MSASAPDPSPPTGASPEPAPVALTEFFCHECQSSVWLPVAAAHPMAWRPPCPLCRGNFIEPAPRSFPGLNPTFDIGLIFVSEDSEGPVEFDEIDELDAIEIMNPVEARLHITRFIHDRLYAIAAPDDIAAATAAAMSLLDHHIHNVVLPAPVASIAALPTVEVSDRDADCAICLEDLPLASAALMLPCSHLYHSCCIVSWLQVHNSCPMCRSRLPVANPAQTTITIRLVTARPRARVNDGAMFAEAPVSSSPTQLAQAGTGEGGGGPANSGDTVSSEWPPQPDSDTVMSEARDGDGFFD